MKRKNRRRVAKIAVPLLLSPIMVCWIIREAIALTASGVDWCVQDRAWSELLLRWSERLEIWSAQ